MTNHEHVLAPDDPRTLLAGAVRTAGGVIAGLRPEQMELPTPCPDFDVRDLTAHLVAVLDRLVVIGRFGNLFEMAPPEPVADGEWLDRWTAAAHEVQGVWSDDALLDATVQVPWTTMPGRDALAVYTNELTVHGWDLARATAQSVAWDPEVVEASLRSIHAEMPEPARDAQWAAAAAEMPPGVPFSPPFADAVEVPDDAPAIDRLVAWNGRRP